MTTEPENLTLQLLREIRAEVAEIKEVQSDHTTILREHSVVLGEHSAAMTGVLNIMQAIHSRVSRIEKHVDLQPV